MNSDIVGGDAFSSFSIPFVLHSCDNLLTSVGADEAIDYTKQKFEIVARDLDVVFDAIGGEYETRYSLWSNL
jgi:hypothetical protein